MANPSGTTPTLRRLSIAWTPTQVKLMLRDGLHPDMLEENERQIYIDTYGLKSLEDTQNDNDKYNNQRPHPNQGQDQGVPSDDK